MKKRITALLLALALAAPLCPSAFAEDEPKDVIAGPDAETEAAYEPDPEGSASFANLERRVRENNLQYLAIQENVTNLENFKYDQIYESLRTQLNNIASGQYFLSVTGQGDSYQAVSLSQAYDSLRGQFDAIKNGDLQEDNAGVLRQLRNLQNQIVMGGETLYMAVTSMEAREASLERQLEALDRSLEELALRHRLGQVSALQLSQARTGRAQLSSALATLRMNIWTNKSQLEQMLGAEQTGALALGAVPGVTEEELSAMDLEADLKTARELSYELFDARETLKEAKEAYGALGGAGAASGRQEVISARHGVQAAQYTYDNTVQTYELRFRTLYAQVKDYGQILEASKAAVGSKEASYAASELKYRQGNISKNALLDAEDELTEAKEAVRSAENDLFTAYNNYCWAVKTGILN